MTPGSEYAKIKLIRLRFCFDDSNTWEVSNGIAAFAVFRGSWREAALRSRCGAPHGAQPALSRQIQDLEKEMGFVLFDRLPRGVRLNAAGRLFLTDARRILQDVDEAKLRAERIAHGKAGTLRIGIATAVSWHGIVVDSFRELRRWQPDVELELQHLLSVNQVEAILSGRLDAGFAASLTPWHKDLAHWEFAQDRMVLAVPKGHALTKRKTV